MNVARSHSESRAGALLLFLRSLMSAGSATRRAARLALTSLLAIITLRLGMAFAQLLAPRLAEWSVWSELMLMLVVALLLGSFRFTLSRQSGPACREVTVLFVDMRDYTRLTENMTPAQIYQTVCWYAEQVALVIGACRGRVLSVAGDGVMAVFEDHGNACAKEERAVDCSLKLARRFEATVDPVTFTAVSIGVGVATGAVCLASIPLAEGAAPSALGNATNLASRLQSMTRDLDAAVIIDSRTHALAGEWSDRLRPRPGIQVKGRRRTEDIYVLPRPVAAPSVVAAPVAHMWT
jgi:class 3 adenylate cyclase